MPMVGPTTDHKEIRRWADENGMVPFEQLPHRLNHEPATLSVLRPGAAERRKDVEQISWEEFFAKFDALGLTFVYDADSTGLNELLQREEDSPYRSGAYQMNDMAN